MSGDCDGWRCQPEGCEEHPPDHGFPPPATEESPPDSDFCSDCHEHTDFEQDELGEWLSACCSARAVEVGE